MKDFQYAVVIGRFQPMHNAHKKLIERALSVAEHVIVVIGSYQATRTFKNPFSYGERSFMIHTTLAEQTKRISFVSARDYLYNDNLWITEVQMKVATVAGDNRSICIVGSMSDDTSYYLACFPHWKQVMVGSLGDFHSTNIREYLFSGRIDKIESLVPQPVFNSLVDFSETPLYKELKNEFDFVNKYKADWSRAPYPPTFVTVDAVVVKSGHVLLVKRRSAPGKGLYALPGGFVGQRETIKNATIREVKEETGLWLPPASYVNTVVFDHPDRSLRGRTITHASMFDLGSGELPLIRGGDDAESAHWMAMNDVIINEEHFFEDHLHIIQSMVWKQ